MAHNMRGIPAPARQCRHSVALPLTTADDRHIDAALEQVGLARADLFTPVYAIAHRVYTAHMLAAHHINVVRAASSRWEELKQADECCARCSNPGRCRRWLEWGGPDDAPAMFCPNAALFDAIAAQQAQDAETGEEISCHLAPDQ